MAIMFVSANSDWYDNDYFYRDGAGEKWGNVRFATLGGVGSRDSFFGALYLRGAVNTDSDVNLGKKQFIQHLHTGTDKVTELFTANEYYNKNHSKSMIYKVATDNSNSYARGLLKAVGFNPTLPDGIWAPGWGRPVAADRFGF